MTVTKIQESQPLEVLRTSTNSSCHRTPSVRPCTRHLSLTYNLQPSTAFPTPPKPNENLINLQQLVPLPPRLQRALEPLHHREHLLLLQPLSDDLNADGQAVHALRVVQLVRALRHAVELPAVEIGGKGVEGAVDVGDWEDAGGVVELLARKRQQ